MVGASQNGDRRDFFVSYTASDRGWAEWIAWQLEEADYTVLLQAWDMVVGSNWQRMMNQATQFAERTVAVLSNAYLEDSPFGEAEWLVAFADDPQGLAGRLIPVRVEDCKPAGLLAGVVYADLVGRDKAEAQEVLLGAIRGAIARRIKPLAEPVFPGIAEKLTEVNTGGGLDELSFSESHPAEGAGPAPGVGRSTVDEKTDEAVIAPGKGAVSTVDGGAAGRVARSEYLSQVRQIAPQALLGRGC
ncbi:toll/interleukin-1 receptor domain-containing protein [Cryptosporangium japonicum]